MAQADLTRLVSTLKIAVRPRHRQFASPEGPAGRLRRLKATVTALVKYERIELHEPRADEARGYAERVISNSMICLKLTGYTNPSFVFLTISVDLRRY